MDASQSQPAQIKVIKPVELNEEQLLSSKFDHQSPRRYINRELSWLKFNRRVLEEAFNASHPLLERLRFLTISASNLDEFYMVRVAGLKAQVATGASSESPDQMTPAQQLQHIDESIALLRQGQQSCLEELLGLLEKEGIQLVLPDHLNEFERGWLSKRFQEQIFPVLSPLAVDPAHPFPFIPNLGFSLALGLENESDGSYMTALVILPNQLPRFIHLPGHTNRFISLVRVVLMYLDQLFPGFKVLAKGVFRVIRDSEMEIDEEAEDLVRTFKSALNRRRRGSVVRLSVDEEMPEELMELIVDQLNVSAGEVFRFKYLGLPDFKELIVNNRPDLLFPAYTPRFPERIRDFGGDCFAAISAKDIIVHHPYESFDVVVQFIRQASLDPNVVSIKQTLYRTSEDSPIVQALVEGAEAGKSVTVMVELKARFDEANNIRMAERLEEVGVQVVYGVVNHKVHAKMMLILRREEDGIRLYGHLGTGNYHSRNARIYTDLSLLTADPDITADMNDLFMHITGMGRAPQLRCLLQSPFTLFDALLDAIETETRHGPEGRIIARVNALVEPELIRALYRASQAGVEIDLIVRGACALRPGIPGISAHIRVRSIVGRFLEHSRAYYFGNGGHPKLWISSADWMGRNLFRRLEVAVPILDSDLRARVLQETLQLYLEDDCNAWAMRPDGTYTFLRKTPDTACTSAQDRLLAQYDRSNPA